MRGTVVTGLGKASGFTQVPWVLRELEQQLAIRPFPGTFNVRLEQAADLDVWNRLKKQPGIMLTEPGASCVAVCYPVLVNEATRGAILIPHVPGYPVDQVEIVSATAMRQHLGVLDGDEVTLRIVEPDDRAG